MIPSSIGDALTDYVADRAEIMILVCLSWSFLFSLGIHVLLLVVLLVLLMLLLMGMILRMLVVMLGPYSPTPLLSLVREVRSPLRCSRFN